MKSSKNYFLCLVILVLLLLGSLPAGNSNPGSFMTTVASVVSDRVDVFVLGKSWDIWSRTYQNGAWSGWTAHGGASYNRPAAVNFYDTVYVFVIGTDERVYYKKITDSDWTRINNFTYYLKTKLPLYWAPAVGNIKAVFDRQKSQINLYARSKDGNLWKKTLDLISGQFSQLGEFMAGPIYGDIGCSSITFDRATSFFYTSFNKSGQRELAVYDSALNRWVSCGGIITSEPIEGALESITWLGITTGLDNNIWTCFYLSWDSAFIRVWNNIGSPGEPIKGKCVVTHIPYDNTLDLFVRGANSGSIYYRYCGDGCQNKWGDWVNMGGTYIGGPEAARTGWNGLYVFAKSTGSALYYNKWNGYNWEGWKSLGGWIQ
jgi:hypothetical protein